MIVYMEINDRYPDREVWIEVGEDGENGLPLRLSYNFSRRITTMKEAVKKVFDDLDEYRDFCRIYGRVFNEAHLYKERTPYDDFLKWKDTGKVTLLARI